MTSDLQTVNTLLFIGNDVTSWRYEVCMPTYIFPGTVISAPCPALRDTSCSTVGMKTSLINPKGFTGLTATCVMFDGTEYTLPTAHAHIDAPFFTGNVVAMVLPSPVTGIILGNIVSANDSTWKESNVGRHEQEPDDTREVANVMTRAQKIAEERVRNQDASTQRQPERNIDSKINLNSLGKLDKRTFRI